MMACELSDSIEIVGLCDDFPDNDQGAFTQIKVPEVVIIPEQKPDIEQIIQILVDARITNLKIIETPEGVSEEGQILTGEKLAIEGKIDQKIIYVADVEGGSQPVHSAEFDAPFSTFIVVPRCYVGLIGAGDEELINLQTCIESVFIEGISPREIIKSSLLFINAIFPRTTVTIANPPAGEELVGGEEVVISGSASGGGLLNKVEVYVDDELLDKEVLAEPSTNLDYSIAWTPAEVDEDKVIEVIAFDCEDNEVASAEITVTVVPAAV